MPKQLLNMAIPIAHHSSYFSVNGPMAAFVGKEKSDRKTEVRFSHFKPKRLHPARRTTTFRGSDGRTTNRKRGRTPLGTESDDCLVEKMSGLLPMVALCTGFDLITIFLKTGRAFMMSLTTVITSK